MNGRPSQCFLFKSCGRKVENATFDCALNKENTLEIKPFVEDEDECEALCQAVSHFVFGLGLNQTSLHPIFDSSISQHKDDLKYF